MKRLAIIAFATAVVYLMAASLYSLAFLCFPWPEMMNDAFRAVFGLLGLILFSATCAMTIVTLCSRKFSKRATMAFACLATVGIAIGGWMILRGPYAHISLSTVEIANRSSIQLDKVVVACRGHRNEIVDFRPGSRKTLSVLPENEGPLRLDFYVGNEIIASAETIVFEATGERFYCTIGPDKTAYFEAP